MEGEMSEHNAEKVHIDHDTITKEIQRCHNVNCLPVCFVKNFHKHCSMRAPTRPDIQKHNFLFVLAPLFQCPTTTIKDLGKYGLPQ